MLNFFQSLVLKWIIFMKKQVNLLAIIITALFSFNITACSNENSSSSSKDTNPAEQQTNQDLKNAWDKTKSVSDDAADKTKDAADDVAKSTKKGWDDTKDAVTPNDSGN